VSARFDTEPGPSATAKLTVPSSEGLVTSRAHHLFEKPRGRHARPGRAARVRDRLARIRSVVHSAPDGFGNFGHDSRQDRTGHHAPTGHCRKDKCANTSPTRKGSGRTSRGQHIGRCSGVSTGQREGERRLRAKMARIHDLDQARAKHQARLRPWTEGEPRELGEFVSVCPALPGWRCCLPPPKASKRRRWRAGLSYG
jgi:hypothetical protein